ncbi:MAG: zinc dependent phospholipase C family protein [Thermodesulfovibrionales bacterium]|nr:zinc dependent phospholipase C family protein [Thermodesulfovibrionales bacterium]
MLKVIFLTAFFVYLPEDAFAWGPMTHCYLANELLKYLALLPPDISLIIRNFKQDFIYGNIMADSVMGKRFMPKQNHSHSWEFALSLFKQASTQSEKSFVYGYLCHLAADTVAHRELTIKMKDIEHSWVEFTLDSLVDKTNRIKSLTINRLVQKRNDRFLKKSIPHHVLPFDTHKRIFKGFLVISALTNFSMINNLNINRKEICKLHEESIIRMIDVMSNGFQSCVTKEDPSPYQDV